jgi:general secretion pathway protein L
MSWVRLILSADNIHLIVAPQRSAAHQAGEPAAPPLFAWWKTVSGRLVQSGVADDVLAASGFTLNDRPDQVTLLLSNDDAAVRLYVFNDITPPQAIAATRIAALDAAIDNADMLQGAAALLTQNDGGLTTISAVARRDVLHMHLAHLRDIGLEPAYIYPAAALINALPDMVPAPDQKQEQAGGKITGYARFALAGQDYLIGPELAASDDPALRQALLIDGEPQLLDDIIVHSAMAALPSSALPNLRHGIFAARSNDGLFSAGQKKWLTGLVTALLLVTFLIPALRLWRYSSAEDAAISAVLSKVQADFPAATDMTTARTLIDSELAKRGAGASIFSVPASALLSALEQAPALTIQNLRYQPGGIVSATIKAPNAEAMNGFLEDLQNNQGYMLTCQQCTTPGATIFDITVRG